MSLYVRVNFFMWGHTGFSPVRQGGIMPLDCYGLGSNRPLRRIYQPNVILGLRRACISPQ